MRISSHSIVSMKKSLSLLALFSFLGVPLSVAFAKLDIPTGIDSIHPDGKYAPPCSRGDFQIGDSCVERRFFGALRSDTSLRRSQRMMTRPTTHRTQQDGVRTSYTHPTGVRASQSNGFELLEPNSRQYRQSESEFEFNLRMLRARQAQQGPATSRVDTTPEARATTRTKQNNFWDPTNMRVRRGLRY